MNIDYEYEFFVLNPKCNTIDRVKDMKIANYYFCVEFINHLNINNIVTLFLDGFISFDLLTKDKLPQIVNNSAYRNKLFASKYITNDFIKNNIEIIDWEVLSKSLTKKIHTYINIEDFVYEYREFLNLNAIIRRVHLSEELIEKCLYKIDFNVLSLNGQTFSNEFYDKYNSKLRWDLLVKTSDIKEEVLLKYIFKMSINKIVKHQRNISHDFLNRYASRINFTILLHNHINIPEQFLIDNILKLNVKCINRIIWTYPNYSTLLNMIGLDRIEKNHSYDKAFALKYGLRDHKRKINHFGF